MFLWHQLVEFLLARIGKNQKFYLGLRWPQDAETNQSDIVCHKVNEGT
jgi:hypothetical protein